MSEIPDYEPSYEASIAGIAESSNKSVMEVLYEELLKMMVKPSSGPPFHLIPIIIWIHIR